MLATMPQGFLFHSWLVGFYGILTIVGYLMPKSSLYILNIWFEYILLITFLNEPELISFCTQLNGFKYFLSNTNNYINY